MEKRKIILDTDPGVDDVVAIVTALGAEEIDLIGITCVGGNVAVEKTTANACGVVNMCRRNEIPVYKGCSKPMKKQTDVCASEVHGESGVIGLEIPEHSKSPEKNIHAIDFIIDSVMRSEKDEISIVTIGPMTNLGYAFEKEPLIAEKIKEIVIMGGVLEEMGGNVSKHAEFNTFMDPDAAKIVFDKAKKITLFPLDVTNKAVFTKQHRNAIRNLDGFLGPNIANMLDECVRIFPRYQGDIPQHDANTITYLISPELYKGKQGRIKIIVDGEKSGKIVLDENDKNPNTCVMLEVNSDGFFNLINEKIANAAKFIKTDRQP